ncbi:MAG: thioredoxin [Psychroflexus sp.]|uniref:thioredoxin n=1 Tax=Psychroflexus sp. S27 TaxID=1982757 RepID=UPI000C29AA35|nr:thioredoxin [Psychroflexus sp. S27]PJX24551.1 thioredoxin [Psychroflexus sp. S27]
MSQKFNAIVQSEVPVLVDFYADWCGPCKALSPILKEVKEQLGDNVKIIKVDVDKNQSLAQKFQVKGVPTLIIYKRGEQKWRQSGVSQKDDLIKIIQSF